MTAPNVPPPPVIDGDQVLNEVHAAFGKYVVFPAAEAHDATVLWSAATHGQQSWEHAPRLAVLSPEKRCGKSRLMDVAEALCYHPLVTVNASTAAVVRSITETDQPTLMVDEADTIFGTKKAAENNEDVRGILNAGHQRNRPYTRWDMTSRSIENCPTFAMAMIASIGDLPDTIMDRAIPIRMRRRGPGEKVAPFRSRRDQPPLHGLRDRLHEWVRGNLKVLQEAEPHMPVEDRAADTWEPLFAIAELAGGEWPKRVRKACIALTGEDPDDGRIGTQLLADLKEVWDDSEDRLFTTTLIERLCEIEEAPWSEWGRERKAITASGLAGLLRNYRISSTNVRIGDEQKKGYYRAELVDAWLRYVPTVSQASQRPEGGETPSQPRDGDEEEETSRARPSAEAPLWDGPGTESDSDSRPRPDKGRCPSGDGGTAGTGDVRGEATTNGHRPPPCPGDWDACGNQNCLIFSACAAADAEPTA
jgi:Protein of unknown function (DUF3631)